MCLKIFVMFFFLILLIEFLPHAPHGTHCLRKSESWSTNEPGLYKNDEGNEHGKLSVIEINTESTIEVFDLMPWFSVLLHMRKMMRTDGWVA